MIHEGVDECGKLIAVVKRHHIEEGRNGFMIRRKHMTSAEDYRLPLVVVGRKPIEAPEIVAREKVPRTPKPMTWRSEKVTTLRNGFDGIGKKSSYVDRRTRTRRSPLHLIP